MPLLPDEAQKLLKETEGQHGVGSEEGPACQKAKSLSGEAAKGLRRPPEGPSQGIWPRRPPAYLFIHFVCCQSLSTGNSGSCLGIGPFVQVKVLWECSLPPPNPLALHLQHPWCLLALAGVIGIYQRGVCVFSPQSVPPWQIKGIFFISGVCSSTSWP